jgi:hypothetical protein
MGLFTEDSSPDSGIASNRAQALFDDIFGSAESVLSTDLSAGTKNFIDNLTGTNRIPPGTSPADAAAKIQLRALVQKPVFWLIIAAVVLGGFALLRKRK